MPIPTPPKKILYIITKSNFGGAQRYVYELATALDGAGQDVAVAAGGSGELLGLLEAAKIRTMNIAGLDREINFFRDIQAFLSLLFIIRSYKPDVVHLNSGKAGLLGALAARLLFVPKIVFTAHGWSFLEPRARWWKIMVWLGSYLTAICSHHVILVSRHDQKHTNMLGVKHKCLVIHTAVQNFPHYNREDARTALFTKEETALHLHDLWLVTIGELNQNKNHSAAIDAVAEFNSTHSTKVFYTIIGEGDLVHALKEQVDLRGQNEYISFKGHLADGRKYLLAFDVFLLPSKKEGLPYALLEAGIAGLPVIASKTGGIPEVVEDLISGILIDGSNHIGISAALDYLLNNPDERNNYAINLKEVVVRKFALAEMIAQTNKVYFL